MATLEALKPICGTDETRVKLHTPFKMLFEGRAWAAATDGHALAAIHHDGELREDGPNAAGVIPKSTPTHAIDAAALRAWAGAPIEQACDECDAEGEVDHDCDCRHCDFGPREKCEACDGTGKVYADRFTVLLGSVLNRNLLWRVLQSAPATGDVLIAGSTDCAPFVFRADGWLGLVMPITKHSTGYREAVEKKIDLRPAPLPAQPVAHKAKEPRT